MFLRKGGKVSVSRPMSGSSILELPGAMIILLLFVFFPLLSVLGLGIKYGACASLNALQLHEASLLPKSKADDPSGTVKKVLPERWMSESLGVFVAPLSFPKTEISYRDGQETPDGVDKLVAVKTTVVLPPFINVPLIPKVPGLSAPLTFVLEAERPLENRFNYDS